MLRLRPYQRDALKFSLARQFSALYIDMRLGKTRVAIRRVKVSRASFILVAAPYSALSGWADQLAQEGERAVFSLVGTRTARLSLLQEAFKQASEVPSRGRVWCLINKEGHRVIRELANSHFDAVIIDESTFIKNPRADVTKYYTQNFRETILRLVLTGTPAPEHPLEYLCQLMFLDPSLLPGNYYETRMAWFSLPKDRPDSHVWFLTRQGKRRLAAVLERVAFFLSRDDVNLGGEKFYQTRKVRLCSKARKAYQTVEDEFILSIDDLNESTIWATQQFIWMRRLTGGSVPVEHDDPIPVDDAKVRALAELVTGELAGQRLVVWAVFHTELDYIYDRLRKQGVESAIISGDVPPPQREWAREQFNAGKIRVLICQPEVFKHGVDLGEADTMVYYSTPCGLETRLQSEDRIVRVGKEKSLLIIDLVAEDTIDEDILTSLRGKERRSQMMKRIVEGAKVRHG